jgi:hypothetical protein
MLYSIVPDFVDNTVWFDFIWFILLNATFSNIALNVLGSWIT